MKLFIGMPVAPATKALPNVPPLLWVTETRLPSASTASKWVVLSRWYRRGSPGGIRPSLFWRKRSPSLGAARSRSIRARRPAT